MITLRWLLILNVFCIFTGACIARTVWRESLSSAAAGRSRQARKLRTLQRILSRQSPTDVWLSVADKRASGDMTVSQRSRYLSSEDPTIRDEANFPEIECPLAEDGLQLFACPTPNEFGQFKCIDDSELCDQKDHCPNGEDEDKTVCMFHKMTMNYFKVLMDAMLGLTRSMI